jgi:hypothetical protein
MSALNRREGDEPQFCDEKHCAIYVVVNIVETMQPPMFFSLAKI